jgi:hypothetical protein
MLDENKGITFDAEVEKIFKASPAFLIVFCSVLFFIILLLISNLLLGFRFSQKEVCSVRIDSRKSLKEDGTFNLHRAEKFELVLEEDSSDNKEKQVDNQRNHDLMIKGSIDMAKITKNGKPAKSLKLLFDTEKMSSMGWMSGEIIDLHRNNGNGLTDFTILIKADEYPPLLKHFYFNVITTLEIELEEKNFYAYIFNT